MDFSDQFEVVGLLARWFKGGLSIVDMMGMTFRDIMFWYDIYELQATEEELVNELSYDDKGKKRSLPSPSILRAKVKKKIEERRLEYGVW